MTQLTTNSLAYVCLHEAGHAAATYYVGGTVEFIELLPDRDSRGPARTNATRPDSGRRTIACAGFAVEYLLFKANRLVDSNQRPLTEKAFIDASINNASADKISFFGADYMQPDGTWPARMDREFMDLAIYQVVPRLNNNFSRIQELAVALESTGRVERQEIERILLQSDDNG